MIMGKILRVNLTTRQIKEEPYPEALARQFMGGAAAAIKLFYDEVDPKADALSPANTLVASLGFLCGTAAATCSRVAFVAKSPLSGTVGYANAGGFFPNELRATGVQAIIIEGKADAPVYLWITDGKAEIRDATEYWGLSTIDTQHYLQQALHDGNIKVACIGPAGERLVKYAAIINERRAAGRKGLGAVMGAKNLKAIAVRGHQELPPLADPAAFKEAAKVLLGAMKDSPVLYPRFRNFGTAGNVELTVGQGDMPAKNFQEPAGEEYLPIGAQAGVKLRTRHYACDQCPVMAGQVRTVSSGPYAGYTTEGPEFESLYSLGSDMGIADLGACIAMDRLCDELGLDTVSFGATVAMAMELYERGILKRADVDGFDLKFGNHEAAVAMLRKIAYREGFGDVLAEGCRIAAQRIGGDAPKYAMHVKGLEFPGYDPRGLKSMALNYMTTFTGADHSRGHSEQEVFGIPVPCAVDRLAIEGKAALTIFNQDCGASVKDSSMLCTFVVRLALLPKNLGPKLVADFWKAAQGYDVTEKDVKEVGERMTNLARAWNLRAGFTRADDTLPDRLLMEPLQKGASKGHRVSPEDRDFMLDEYYNLRGWDKKGVPTPERLKALGLADVAKDLVRL
ncbi:MAG TPA: aldehyde ferredoxin oxidoreductase family protein [Candidatus Sulfotelmatobacter sp.]|nr:aldehyde ferredoxin oxidoreductase family protein [Candidatus Sulfotelmatobacter sp.]